MSLHVQRIGDELVLTMLVDQQPIGAASVQIPEGVDELVEAVLREAGMWVE